MVMKWFIPTAMAAAVITGAIALRNERPATSATQTTPPVAAKVDSGHKTPVVAGSTTSAVAAQISAPSSTADSVERLVRLNTPKSLYEAYKLVQPCAFRKGDCADITQGQIASRREWLARAAEAGVHGAVTDWFAELYGADHVEGREISDADQARLAHYIDVGAAHGDKHSLVLKHGQALRAGDDVRALAYAVAAGEGDGKMANQLRRGMTAEQIARAEKEGREIAQRAADGRS